jgi:predicted NAD/FAD-dependent oxidoreductase
MIFSKSDTQQIADILIIGAGMTGLMAASDLQSAGYRIVIIDKGRGVGGRIASRRVGKATFDHGAQFITSKNPRFAKTIESWQQSGVVEEWYLDTTDGRRCWRGTPAMTAVAKNLAGKMEILLGKRVLSIIDHKTHWTLHLDDGKVISAKAVLLTPPVPQSLAILNSGGIDLPNSKKVQLNSVEYESCLAVMAMMGSPSRIPKPGYMKLNNGPIVWVADNQMKGVSKLPAVTIHASTAFSLEMWEYNWEKIGLELLKSAESWIGSDVIDFQIHGWRYSRPVRIQEKPYVILSSSPPLIVAGDAFGGASVEGAAISGWAAADRLKKM